MCYIWFRLATSLPAHLFAGINVAPTRQAMNKEFDMLYTSRPLQWVVRTRKHVPARSENGAVTFLPGTGA